MVYSDAHIFYKAWVFDNVEIKHGSIDIRYNFTSTAQVEEYLKSTEEFRARLDAIGAKNILRK